MDPHGKRWIGWMWIVLGPIILFLSLYSSYLIEMVFLIAVAGVGFIGGSLFVRGNMVAAKVLALLSKIVYLYCWGSVLFNIAVHFAEPGKPGPGQIMIQVSFAITNIVIGIVFFLISRKLEVEPDESEGA